MKPAARLLAYVLPALLASWAGARLYGLRVAGQEGIAVPAGVASAPDPGEIAVSESVVAGALPGERIPEVLPAFALHDLNGRTRTVGEWRGRSLIINFWATWCDPCRREIPLLESLDSSWAARDGAVIGVAVDYPEKVSAFAREFAIRYPLLVGEEDALDLAARLGVKTPVFPFTVFTDRRGRIVTLFLGELHRPEADLILRVVSAVNQDRLALTPARQAIAAALKDLKDQTTEKAPPAKAKG